MGRNFFIGLILAAILVVVGFFATRIFNNQTVYLNLAPRTPTTIIPTSLPTQTPTPIIPAGWESYRSESIGISLNHPTELEVTENEDGSVRFLLFGPTQTDGTEVYDGLILNFEEGTYQVDTLRDYVDNLVTEKKNEPIGLEVSEVEEVISAGLSGYLFTETGLGTFTNIYLPAGEGEFIHISYLLEDPSGQGFQEILDNIFATLSIRREG